MKFLLTIILYVLIALMVMENQIVIASLLVLWFTYRSGAVWLIPLAILLDGYFGAFTHIPYISLVTCAWYVLSEYLSPRLRMESTYEKTA
ncbi:MAG: hypothetical protein RLZZ480_354 [Candidatus Parcubacteria bacterium]|jgi:hypothetical protein